MEPALFALAESKAAVPPDWALRLRDPSAPGGSVAPHIRIGAWRRKGNSWMRSYSKGALATVYWNAGGESDELKIIVELPLKTADRRNPIVFSTYPRSDGTAATPWDLRVSLGAYDSRFPFFPDENGQSRLQFWRDVQRARTADVERAMRLCDFLLVSGLEILAKEDRKK